ncbi:hypothetical protein [Peterkaempfera sp. SMS 1(5)a]|uniref:hypothetical protein n=1 Tax=Peterkaempfera podocarpi TaxID=3232308 RepID=UPI00366AC17E
MTVLYAGAVRHRAKPGSVLPAGAQDVLAVVADPSRPVHLVVTTGRAARRSFVSWQPWDARTGTGNCYTALPAAVCEALLEAGLIAPGPVVQDPSRQVRTVGLTEAGRRRRARPSAYAA